MEEELNMIKEASKQLRESQKLAKVLEVRLVTSRGFARNHATPLSELRYHKLKPSVVGRVLATPSVNVSGTVIQADLDHKRESVDEMRINDDLCPYVNCLPFYKVDDILGL